jgi:protein-disulfide isomerase-like protein with CxxC motif
MEHYDLEVLEDDEAIEAVWSVALQNPKALWPRIADLAKKVYAPGRKIRVTNQLGEMVILIGVAAALRCASSFRAT